MTDPEARALSRLGRALDELLLILARRNPGLIPWLRSAVNAALDRTEARLEKPR